MSAVDLNNDTGYSNHFLPNITVIFVHTEKPQIPGKLEFRTQVALTYLLHMI